MLALQGVAELHSVGIVHADLKPRNLLMLREQGRLVVKVIDLGISGLVDPQTGELVGKNLVSCLHARRSLWWN